MSNCQLTQWRLSNTNLVCSDVVLLAFRSVSLSLSTLVLTYYFGLAAAGFVYHPYMVTDSVGKCELPGGKISYSRLFTETDIPLLEPPQGRKTYWYGPGLHLWLSLLCGGWHSLASRNALARGSRHWGILAGEAWAPAWDWACLCTSRLWVLAQTWACSGTPLKKKKEVN